MQQEFGRLVVGWCPAYKGTRVPHRIPAPAGSAEQLVKRLRASSGCWVVPGDEKSRRTGARRLVVLIAVRV
jgi:hypothetical protein